MPYTHNPNDAKLSHAIFISDAEKNALYAALAQKVVRLESDKDFGSMPQKVDVAVGGEPFTLVDPKNLADAKTANLNVTQPRLTGYYILTTKMGFAHFKRFIKEAYQKYYQSNFGRGKEKSQIQVPIAITDEILKVEGRSITAKVAAMTHYVGDKLNVTNTRDFLVEYNPESKEIHILLKGPLKDQCEALKNSMFQENQSRSVQQYLQRGKSLDREKLRAELLKQCTTYETYRSIFNNEYGTKIDNFATQKKRQFINAIFNDPSNARFDDSHFIQYLKNLFEIEEPDSYSQSLERFNDRDQPYDGFIDFCEDIEKINNPEIRAAVAELTQLVEFHQQIRRFNLGYDNEFSAYGLWYNDFVKDIISLGMRVSENGHNLQEFMKAVSKLGILSSDSSRYMLETLPQIIETFGSEPMKQCMRETLSTEQAAAPTGKTSAFFQPAAATEPSASEPAAAPGVH